MVAAVRHGRPQRQVATEFGVALSTLQWWLARAGMDPLDQVDWSTHSRAPGRVHNRTSPEVELAVRGDAVEIAARARTTYRTGVEMEAMVAASVAALTVYDMCKSIERGMVIEEVKLMSKSGGRSGEWRREK